MIDHALSIVGTRNYDGFLCKLVQGGGVEDIPSVLDEKRKAQHGLPWVKFERNIP